MSMDDTALLQEYARTGADSAFATLVQRHVGLVYSAARRQVRDPQLAEDVTQVVFTVLARKAGQVARHPGLSGWLLQTTRYAANSHLRAAVRRTQREQEAAMQSEPDNSHHADWAQLEPLLDEAMASLGTTDRAVLALRYFENKTAAEIGQSLALTEEAAKKRAHRALEKLRKFFGKRGVALSSGAIATAVSAHAVHAAPAGLALTVTSAVFSGTTATVGTLLATTKIIAMTTLQKIAFTGALAAAVGAGIYEARQAARTHAEADSLQQQLAPLTAQNEALARELNHATNRTAGLSGEIAKNQKNILELLRLRAEITRLKYQPPAAVVPSPAPTAEKDDGIDGDLTAIKNAHGIVLDGGQVLNFTNGVAVVPGADYPNSATDRDEYYVGRLLGCDDTAYFCETSVNSGGSGTDMSLGIFTKDASGAFSKLQMLEVGDRVQIYNFDQDGNNLAVFYLDHGNEAMAQPPTQPKKTVFTLNPATGQYVKGSTYIPAVSQPWVEEPPSK